MENANQTLPYILLQQHNDNMQVEREEGPSTEAYIVSMPHHEMRSVVHRCANSSRRTDIASMSHENTRLEKLKAAVISRLPQSWAPKRVEEYGTKVEAIVTAAWKIFGQVHPHLHQVSPCQALLASFEALVDESLLSGVLSI